MRYSGESYAFLFDKPTGEIQESAFELLRHENVIGYRTKTIKSGSIVECEIYPIWKTGQIRKAKEATTREAQKNLNEKNAKKHLIRKINANFTEKDLCITLTYKGSVPDEKEAQKDIQNYIRRVKAYRKKNGMDEMKYIYVIEYENGEGEKKKKRIHHHIIMSGMDREEAERIWQKGYANTRRLQPDEYGLEALARYIVKDPQGKKRWSASRNLKEPKITVSDTKFSKRKAERLAKDFEAEGRKIFEKLFPACQFNDCTISRSDFVAGAYIYARMKEDPEKAKKIAAERKRKRVKG